ncbi:MAG TPA: regulatory protein RecX [Albitalea sp.]|jgi:regulatory protein|nr:regulatory protein RecX [Albitalea sp.]
MLAQREHSVAELRRKLIRHLQMQARVEAAAAAAALASELPPAGRGEPAHEASADDAASRVDTVIDWLREHQHLSEERFVESRVHARSSRYGNLRIRQELAQHGLALSTEAAQALKDSELERALQVWRRKFDVSAAADAAERARQSRFLAQRGFSAETIARVMREAGRRRAAASDFDAD